MIDIVDLHIHSHYSMATSKNMDIDNIALWARKKGVTIIGAGDIMHPLWQKELRDKLTDLKNGFFEFEGIKFVLSGEVSLVYKKNGKVRKIHLIVTVPDFKTLYEVSDVLKKFGNLETDGRPTLFTDAERFSEELFKISDAVYIIPAHIWTPWFGLFGSKSGFDSIEECFGDESERIFALETGLSSDPGMNYIVRNIDRFTLVSNSDAHSPENIAREANVIKDVGSYEDLFDVIKNADKNRFMFTIEFFPEEGKYFGDGHRKCGVHVLPEKNEKAICSVCKKPLTYGVYHRVMEVANWTNSERKNKKLPYRHVIPLKEILSVVSGKGKKTKTVSVLYDAVLDAFGSELNALLFAPTDELYEKLDKDIADAICMMREEKVEKQYGYDGVYGKITLKGRKSVGLFG